MTTTWDDALKAKQATWTEEERGEYEAARDDAELAIRLAELVYNARTDAGLTQAALAERMGTNQSFISSLEGGGQVPSMTTLARVARATGTHLEVDLAATKS